VLLASALVPFWDERFAGGLAVALFLELAHRRQELPAHVKAMLLHPDAV
jgi:hypothetical protein